MLNEDIVIGTVSHMVPAIRTFAYQLLFEFIRQTKDSATIRNLNQIIYIIGKCLYDPNLSVAIQCKCLTVLSLIREPILKHKANDPSHVRTLLFRMLWILVNKISYIEEIISTFEKKPEGELNHKELEKESLMCAQSLLDFHNALVGDQASKISQQSEDNVVTDADWNIDESDSASKKLDISKSALKSQGTELDEDPILPQDFEKVVFLLLRSLFSSMKYMFTHTLATQSNFGVTGVENTEQYTPSDYEKMQPYIYSKSSISCILNLLKKRYITSQQAKDLLELFTHSLSGLEIQQTPSIENRSFVGFFVDFIPVLVEASIENQIIFYAVQYLLNNQPITSQFIVALLHYIVEHIKDVEECGSLRAVTILRLLKAVFGTISYCKHYSTLLRPHVQTITRLCLKRSTECSEYGNYLYILRLLFKSLNKLQQDDLFQEFFMLLQQFLHHAIRQLNQEHKFRDQWAELCILLPIRFQQISNYVFYLLYPLTLTLQSSRQEIVETGLYLFEQWTDLHPNFFSPFIDRQHILHKLFNSLFVLLYPQSPHTTKVVRILGKLGPRATLYLKEPFEFITKSSDESCMQIKIPISESGYAGIDLDRAVSTALRCIEAGDRCPHPSQKAGFAFLRSCFLAFIGHNSASTNETIYPFVIQPRQEGNTMYFSSNENDPRLQLEVRKIQKGLLSSILRGIFLLWNDNRLSDEARPFVKRILAHFALLWLTSAERVENKQVASFCVHSIDTQSILSGIDNQDAIPDSTQPNYNLAIVDAIFEIFCTPPDHWEAIGKEIAYTFFDILFVFHTDRDSILPRIKYYIMYMVNMCIEKLYEREWTSRYGACRIILILCDVFPESFVSEHIERFVRGLFFVLHNLPSEVSVLLKEAVQSNMSCLVTKFAHIKNSDQPQGLDCTKEMDESDDLDMKSKRIADVSSEENHKEYQEEEKQVKESCSPHEARDSEFRLLSLFAKELFSIHHRIRKISQATLQEYANSRCKTVFQLLEPLHDLLHENLFSGTALSGSTVQDQIRRIAAITFLMSIEPDPIFPGSPPEILSFIEQVLCILQDDSKKTEIQLRTIALECLSCSLAYPFLQRSQELYKNAMSAVVNCFTIKMSDGLKESVIRVIKRGIISPLDLQTHLRQVLGVLTDYKRVTRHVIQSSALVLELAVQYIEASLTKRIASQLKKLNDYDVIRTLHQSSGSEEIVIGIVELLPLLPALPLSDIIESFVCSIVSLESKWLQSNSKLFFKNPFRVPLTKYLNQYPKECLSIFFEPSRLCDIRYSTILHYILESDHGQDVFHVLVENGAELIIQSCFSYIDSISSTLDLKGQTMSDMQDSGDRNAQSISENSTLLYNHSEIRPQQSTESIRNDLIDIDSATTPVPSPSSSPNSMRSTPIAIPLSTIAVRELFFQGIALVHKLVNKDSNWLIRNNLVSHYMVRYWNSDMKKSEMNHEIELDVRYIGETKMLIQSFLSLIRESACEAHTLFSFSCVLGTLSLCDYSFFRKMLTEELPFLLSVDQKKNLLYQFFVLHQDPHTQNLIKVNTLRFIIIPMLRSTFMNTPEQTTFIVDSTAIEQIMTHLLVNHDVEYTENLKVELLRLSTLLLEHMSQALTEHRKELIRFAWSYLKNDDSTSKYWAYINVCRFIDVYDTPVRIIFQVYIALIRAHQPDMRKLVCKALDILLPALHKRLQGHSSEIARWINSTKIVILEESQSIAQLSHLFSVVVNHPIEFYNGCDILTSLILSNLNKLSSQNNLDNYKLSVDLIGLYILWEEAKRHPAIQLILYKSDTGMSDSSKYNSFHLCLIYTIIILYIIIYIYRYYC